MATAAVEGGRGGRGHLDGGREEGEGKEASVEGESVGHVGTRWWI